MNKNSIKEIISSTTRYNLHSHTQFCDGHAPMEDMAAAAFNEGMLHWGFSPHSPICIESPCNMSRDDMKTYLAEVARLQEIYQGRMDVLPALEIDFLSADFGPHIDYFQRLPLDYRIGSVHFVPNQEGVPLDCDGSFERFRRYLRDGYAGDLRYVTEKYFEQVLTMLERGGFDILGHFDKIAGNAAQADPSIEEQGWYEALVDDVISHSVAAGVTVEINTKAIHDRGRFFPARRWWEKLVAAGVPLAVNSDAHWPEKTNLGRDEALAEIENVRKRFAEVSLPPAAPSGE